MKREARNRLAAVRKQAKLRAQKEAAAAVAAESEATDGENVVSSLDSSLNGSLNGSLTIDNGTVDITSNGLDSLNSSTASSVDFINNGLDTIDLGTSEPRPVVQQSALEVNGVA